MKFSFFKNFALLLFIIPSTIVLHAQVQDENPDMRIVLMADLNESYGSTHYGEYVDSALVHIEKWQPDFILFAGTFLYLGSDVLQLKFIQ